MINPGIYRHKITFLKKKSGSASSMTEEETWDIFKIVNAGIDPLQGKAFFQAAKENTEITTRFYIRYLPSITVDMRILYHGRYFDIISIINVAERKEEMHLMCREVL